MTAKLGNSGGRAPDAGRRMQGIKKTGLTYVESW
jgi:hypothetical protein